MAEPQVSGAAPVGQATMTGPAEAREAGEVASIRLPEGATWRLTPGGVCRMVYPTLRLLYHAGGMRRADWLSLQPGAPPAVDVEGLPLRLHHMGMPKADLAAYARTKEHLWAAIHGLESPRFSNEDYRFYARFNGAAADALLAAAPEMDVAYIHDFQLLLTGAIVGLASPTVLRWLVPFVPHLIPSYTRGFLVRAMESFDLVMVSTRRDLEGLANAGFRGRVRQVYPHIDPWERQQPSSRDVQAFSERWGLRPDDDVFVLVARMDPIKRQDLAIRAFARLARANPRAKLMLVGNGSFSSSGTGLGLSKGAIFLRALEELVAGLRLQHRVVFTHWIPEDQVACALARCKALLLPSDVEGFGLTVLEAWRFRKPPIVSSGCGAAETVHDGLNGMVFPSGDEESLAQRMQELLRSPGLCERLGQAGWLTLPAFSVTAAAPRERACLQEAIDAYGR